MPNSPFPEYRDAMHVAVVLLLDTSDPANPAAWLAPYVNPKHPEFGRLTCPGGKLERDETPTPAAAREVAQEVGLTIALDRFRSVGWIGTSTTGGRQVVAYLFIVELAPHERPARMEPGAHGPWNAYPIDVPPRFVSAGTAACLAIAATEARHGRAPTMGRPRQEAQKHVDPSRVVDIALLRSEIARTHDLLDRLGAPRYSGEDETPPGVVLDLPERVRRYNDDASYWMRQGQTDARAVHEALAWAHFWHGKDLPPPSHAVKTLIAQRNSLRVQMDTLETRLRSEHLNAASKLEEANRNDASWQARMADALKTITELRAKVAELEGTLATESAERIRCRDGWAAEKVRAEAGDVRVAELVKACEQMERQYLSEAKDYDEPLRTAYRYGAGVAKVIGAVARSATPVPTPAPAGLLEAVAPLAAKIREVEAYPRTVEPPWQDLDWNLRMPSVVWVAIRVAFDAAKGGDVSQASPTDAFQGQVMGMLREVLQYTEQHSRHMTQKDVDDVLGRMAERLLKRITRGACAVDSAPSQIDDGSPKQQERHGDLIKDSCPARGPKTGGQCHKLNNEKHGDAHHCLTTDERWPVQP